MSISYESSPGVGECFGVLARTASDAIAAFDLLCDKYELDRANQAHIEFIRARETLEPALVEHILRTGSPAVHAALCERVDDLTVEARADLLSRKEPRVVRAIMVKSLIGKAPVETQLRWATSDDGAMRISVIADSRVDNEVAAQALPGLAKTLVKSRTALHNTDLVESLTSRFGYEAAVEVLLEDSTGVGVSQVAIHGAGDAATLRKAVQAWTSSVAAAYEQARKEDGWDDPSVRNESVWPGVLRQWLQYGRLLSSGYARIHPELSEALADLVDTIRPGSNPSISSISEAAETVADGVFVRLADVSNARSTDDGDQREAALREAALSNGDIDAVVGEIEKAMLSGDEFELLIQRDIDPNDKFTLRDFEKELVDRHPRSTLLGEYHRVERAGNAPTIVQMRAGRGILKDALAIEDAARIYTLAELISRRGPDEIGNYLHRRKVDLMPLLELSERIWDITVHDACVILS